MDINKICWTEFFTSNGYTHYENKRELLEHKMKVVNTATTFMILMLCLIQIVLLFYLVITNQNLIISFIWVIPLGVTIILRTMYYSVIKDFYKLFM